MNRTRHLFFAVLVATACPASVWAQQGGIQYDKIEIKTDKLAPNLYMLSGSEGVDPELRIWNLEFGIRRHAATML